MAAQVPSKSTESRYTLDELPPHGTCEVHRDSGLQAVDDLCCRAAVKLRCVKRCTSYPPQSSGVPSCVVRRELRWKRQLQTIDVLVPQVLVGGCSDVDKHGFTVDFPWRKLLFQGVVASNKYCLHLCCLVYKCGAISVPCRPGWLHHDKHTVHALGAAGEIVRVLLKISSKGRHSRSRNIMPA